MTTFSPRAWQPLPAPPLTHDLEKNDVLASATLWTTPGQGPEDVIVDSNGSAFCGLNDGRIVRIDDAGGFEEIANVGGVALSASNGWTMASWLCATQISVSNA